MAFRYTQIHYWLRCTIPFWQHWTANFTQKGLVVQRVHRAIRFTVLAAVFAGLAWVQRNPQLKDQLVQSLLSGKDWMLSTVRGLSGFH